MGEDLNRRAKHGKDQREHSITTLKQQPQQYCSGYIISLWPIELRFGKIWYFILIFFKFDNEKDYSQNFDQCKWHVIIQIVYAMQMKNHLNIFPIVIQDNSNGLLALKECTLLNQRQSEEVCLQHEWNKMDQWSIWDTKIWANWDKYFGMEGILYISPGRKGEGVGEGDSLFCG